MKKTFFVFALFLVAFSAFAQRIPTVGVFPFEAQGAGVSAGDAAEATRLLIAELNASETLTILPGGQAESGNYHIRGQIARHGNQVVLSATVQEASSGRTLNTAREQGASLSAISMFAFAIQLADFIPFPNLLAGTWRSTLNMIDGPITAILEFRPDRTVHVEMYETWEHNGTNSLKYQAIGTGTYTFLGFHLRRHITVEGRRILTDAAMGVNLTLEDALPNYTNINVSGLRMVFDDSRRSFELVNGGLPCGDNFTGPSVHPREKVYYTNFTRIR